MSTWFARSRRPPSPDRSRSRTAPPTAGPSRSRPRSPRNRSDPSTTNEAPFGAPFSFLGRHRHSEPVDVLGGGAEARDQPHQNLVRIGPLVFGQAFHRPGMIDRARGAQPV